MAKFNVRYADIVCEDVKGRLIRNPNYGGPRVSLHGWHWQPHISSHSKQRFQSALRTDIAENGVRNPILVWSLPEGLFLTFGGSRLKACLDIGKDTIPAIINDYTGIYGSEAEVRPDNFADYFTDVPRDFEFGESGADYHYNLERARRANHDPAGFAWLDGKDQSFIADEFPWLLEGKD